MFIGGSKVVKIGLTRTSLLTIGTTLIVAAGILLVMVPFSEYQMISGGEQAMANINRPVVLDAIKANITSYFGNLNRSYSLDELFKWESAYMKFVNGPLASRPTDPREILANGQGKCQEFSILYAAACLSVGYNASVIVVVNRFIYMDTEHAFNEVQFQNGSWVQLDASDFTPTKLVFNDTSVYNTWSWWGGVGGVYRMIAFYGNGKHADVTAHYIS